MLKLLVIVLMICSLGWFTRSSEWELTAYCDNKQPTASGKSPRWGYVANNWLPFGSIVEIKGIGRFVVQDRGSKREFGTKSERRKRLDIWFPHRSQAIQFGRQKIKVKILKGV